MSFVAHSNLYASTGDIVYLADGKKYVIPTSGYYQITGQLYSVNTPIQMPTCIQQLGSHCSHEYTEISYALSDYKKCKQCGEIHYVPTDPD